MSEIPNGIHVPGSYIDINNSRAGALGDAPFRICVLGEHPIKYTGEIIQYQRVLSDGDAYLKYGLSFSYEMLRALFRNLQVGSNVEVYCVSHPCDNEPTYSIAASNTIGMNISTLTKSGQIIATCDGERFIVNVSASDTAATIATNISTAVNQTITMVRSSTSTADLLYALGSGQVSTTLVGTVNTPLRATLQSYNGGPLFLQSSVLTDNVVVDIVTGTVTTPTPVDMADLISALPDDVIDLFVNPYQDSTSYGLLQTEIARRFGPTVQLEGHQIMTTIGTASAIITAMGTADYNDQHLTMWDGGYKRPCSYNIQSAAVAGVIASSISEDPAVPMQYIDLVGVYPELLENKRTFAELNALVPAGVAIGNVDSTGNVETLRLTTTYLTTDGFVDASYRDANTLFTTSYLRQSLLALIGTTFKNYKLADDGIQAASGQKVATPSSIKAVILGWFREQEFLAIVENYDQFAAELVVERDGTDRTRVNVTLPTDIVNQFRIFAGELSFIL